MSEVIKTEPKSKLPIYRRTYSRIWKAMRGLSQVEKNIAHYLLSGDQSNRVGYFDFSPGKAAEDIEISPDEFQAGFVRVLAWFDWKYDETARVIFIPSWWRWNQPEGPKQLIGCLKDLMEVAPSVLLHEFITNVEYLPENLLPIYQEILEKMKLIPLGKGIGKGMPKGIGKGSAFQEQEQEQDKTPPTPPAGGDGAGDFLRWFEAYPGKRRKDRLKAEREWGRLQRQGRLPPLRELLEVLGRQARSEEWEREEGRFIPLPHRYLSLGRFVDASVSPAREPPGTCARCRGSGFRRAKPGEAGIGGQVVCECRAEEGVRGP
jgi:hypothetical protein